MKHRDEAEPSGQKANELVAVLRRRDLERREIAKRLHDDVGGQLIALRMQAELLAKSVPEKAEDAARIAQGISDAVELVSTVSRTLHPTYVETLGLLEAVRYHSEVITQAAKCDLYFHEAAVPIDLEPEIALILFRLCCVYISRSRLVEASRLEIAIESTNELVVLSLGDDGLALPSSASREGGELYELRRTLESLRADVRESTSGNFTMRTIFVPRRTELYENR